MSVNRKTLDHLFETSQIDLRRGDLFDTPPDPLPQDLSWDRIEGMMLGLAIGDALGNTTDGMLPHARKAQHGEILDYIPNRYDPRPMGFPSDDTQLAFWTLDQINIDRGLIPEHVAARFCREHIFGIGATVKAFIDNVKLGLPWYQAGYRMAGNGALMRIAPMLIPHLRSGTPDLWVDTALCAITHNDSASLSACLAFVKILWQLLGMKTPPAPEWWLQTYVATARDLETGRAYQPSGGSFTDYSGPLWQFVEEKVQWAYDRGLSVREACDHWYSGAYLLETVPCVIYTLMRHGDDAEEAIVRAVNDTKDNDTVGAIVGAAVGALHGRSKIPERWVSNLSGRTTDRDDGRIFNILDEARTIWWKKKVLLTFLGPYDPFSLGLIGEEEQSGPILSLVSERPFDSVLLLSTSDQARRAEETRDAIRGRCPGTEVKILDLPLEDSSDHLDILQALRAHLFPVLKTLSDVDLFVSIASGTPQTHTSWVLLVATRELPARLLQVTPSGSATENRPLVSEADLAEAVPLVVPSAGQEIVSREDLVRESDIMGSLMSPRPQLAELEMPHSFYGRAAFQIAVRPAVQNVVNQLGLIGDHPAFWKAVETTELLAESSLPILILGETGTGKELFAKLAHQLSDRSSESFVPLNCAAIPHELAESLLFGHKKGAFTGAVQNQLGKFDQADGGTLFLDELGELPPSAQAKLLRVLEDGVVEPLGAGKGHRVEVRIIAATKQDLIGMVREKKFRDDLYYRLGQGVIELPPLRERGSDIPKITHHCLERLNASLRYPKRFSQSAITRLENHTWPGNIRELKSVIERSAQLCRKSLLEADDLLISDPIRQADPLAALPEPNNGFSLEDFVQKVRKQLFLRALEKAQGNRSEAARLLGVSPQAVHQFMKKIE
ncbi:MAG: hypothetical protein EXS64_18425 [Candidatus Latescibacteria bacterium]|nr:hypothetical protein [Candidatus Latescibacterota bacterium]